jgi:hypothetical protein
MSEIVVYTVAREGDPMIPLGEGWRVSASDSRVALRAAVEAARDLHKSTRGEHHVVREGRVRDEGAAPSERTVFSTRTGG